MGECLPDFGVGPVTLRLQPFPSIPGTARWATSRVLRCSRGEHARYHREPYVGGNTGVSLWRRMISSILALSGGPPTAAFSTAKVSRKYSGPIAAGEITQSAFASALALLSK